MSESTRPARLAWYFGLAHQASLLHWLFLLGPDASIAYRWLIPVSAVFAILYVSIFYLAFGAILGFLRRVAGDAIALLLMPVPWVLMEMARGAGELGFPWCLGGVSFLGTPFYPAAAVLGEIGLGAAAAFTALTVVLLRNLLTGGAGSRAGRRRYLPLLSALAVFCLMVLSGVLLRDRGFGPDPDAGHEVSKRDVPVRVAAVQANVDLGDKWKAARIDSSRVPYSELTAEAAAAGAELVVWAETAVPAYLLYDRKLLRWVRDLADTNDIFLYAGFPDAILGGDDQQQRFNGSGLFGPAGVLRDRYRKHHLLPFGERMPFQGVFPFLKRVDMGQAEWTPGEPPAPMLVDPPSGYFQIAGLICYESIFPGLPRGAVRDGADILVNITNDGWFGMTAGPVQHAWMARLRAAEYGVPLVRCANNGISFITDARGTIRAQAGLGERAVIVSDVVPGGGRTFFAAMGDRPLLILLVLWTIAAVPIGGRRRDE